MKLTPELLQAATGCTAERAEMYGPHLDEACRAYQINTPARLAAFLAQIGHESGSLRHVVELWGPTPAQTRYEGRADLGNTELGDGYRFRGRGLLQTTGRANYKALTTRLRARFNDAPDFEATPSLLQQPRWAALSAADYWGMRNINVPADVGDFEGVTRKINGGLNGQADRLQRWYRATTVLDMQATPPAQIDASEAPAAPELPTPHPPPENPTMALPAIVTALLPIFAAKIPELVGLSNAKGDARKEQAIQLALDVATQAVNARNTQEAAEIIGSDQSAAVTARQAVRERWADIVEAGGGGIDGARAADAAAVAAAGPWWSIFRSPSFVVGCLLLPLVYTVVFSITGVIGNVQWSNDVRASIAGLVVGNILGGLVGYYYGQTTSRNRGPAASAAQTP